MENYYPLRVEVESMNGVWESLKAMRLPKNSENDSHLTFSKDCVMLKKSDKRLAQSLVKAGTDHAKFTRGIIVWLNIKCQAGWLIEFETYRHGVETLSTSSSMHNELKYMSGRELAEQKQKDLSKKVYERSLTVSYQAFRAMYKARRKHRHPDWQIFCDFIETLPFFDIFIYPERRGDESNS